MRTVEKSVHEKRCACDKPSLDDGIKLAVAVAPIMCAHLSLSASLASLALHLGREQHYETLARWKGLMINFNDVFIDEKNTTTRFRPEESSTYCRFSTSW